MRLTSLFFICCAFQCHAQKWLGEGGVNLLDDGEIVVPSMFMSCEDVINGDTIIVYKCLGVRYNGEAEYFSSVLTDSTGKIIYKTNDIDDCWNGVLENGERIPPGEYHYKVSAKMKAKQEPFEFDGKILCFCSSYEEWLEMDQTIFRDQE